MSSLDPDTLRRTRADRAARKIRRRLAIAAEQPPAVRPARRISTSLPVADWEALLAEAGR
jgi:hypothetical protein